MTKGEKLFIFWIIALSFLFSTLPFWGEMISNYANKLASINDYVRITDVDYKAIVDDSPGSNGRITITERLTYDVHAASKNNLFWELWRDLPEQYIDGVHVHYKVNSVKQILEDGTEIVYEESPKLYWDDEDYVNTNTVYGPGKWYHSEGPYDEDYAQYECVLFYVDGLYREEVVFEIEYEMYNAALKYKDCSDLYISMYSGETIQYLESYKAQILFPYKDMPSSDNFMVTTYGTSENAFPVSGSGTMNPGYYTFYFEFDEEDLKFRPYNEYIEFDLVSFGEDAHIFTDYAPDNDYTYEDSLKDIYEAQQEYARKPLEWVTFKIFTFIIILALILLIGFMVFTTTRRKSKKNVFYEPETDYEYFRDIPSDLDPNFAAALVFCRHNCSTDTAGVYSAVLLSLARKKYIYLRQWGASDVEISLVAAGTEEREKLSVSESYYYNLLIRHIKGNSLLMSSLQQRISNDYENTNTFARNLKSAISTVGTRGVYLQKALYRQVKDSVDASSSFLMITGILSTTLVNLISNQTRMDLAYGAFTIFGIACIVYSIYLKKISGKFVLLTQFGADEYAKWRGLYNFLKSDTLINERTYIELPLWEKYLVYATAFGLSKKVIKAIEINCPEASSSPLLSNNCYRSTNFHHAGSSFRSAVHTGTARASSASYSGGGGYGGGGRGGGGGGGGH